MNITFLDNQQITDAKRRMTDEGYMVVEGVLARTGIQDYYAYELGLTDRAPLSTVKIFRSAEEVFNKDSMKSFENKPVTVGHPSELVDSSNWTLHAKGEVNGVTKANDKMVASLTVKAKDAIDGINAGEFVEISNGYTCTVDMVKGTTPEGLTYDGVQRNIRGNHIALVKKARCGSACKIADSQTLTGVDTMKVHIKGIPFEITDAAAAAAIEQLIADNAFLTADAKVNKDKNSVTYTIGDATVTHTGEQIAKIVDGYEATIADLETQVITPEKRDALVADWVKTLDSAKKLDPKITTDGKTCLQIRKDVLQTILSSDNSTKPVVLSILNGKDLKDADEETIRTAFNAASAVMLPNLTANDSTFADAIVKDAQGEPESALSGRDKFLQNQQNGFVTAK